jgi:hypothetical protein
MSSQLSPPDRALFCEWLRRCIETFGALPPTAHRDRSINLLRQQLERHESNILPFRRLVP